MSSAARRGKNAKCPAFVRANALLVQALSFDMDREAFAAAPQLTGLHDTVRQKIADAAPEGNTLQQIKHRVGIAPAQL